MTNMGIALLLLGLSLCGAAVTFLPLEWFGIPREGASGVLDYWLSTMMLFVLPLVLVLLGFTKSFLIRLLRFLLGLWDLALTVALLLQIDRFSPNLTGEGIGLLGLVLVFSASIVVYSAIDFSNRSEATSP